MPEDTLRDDLRAKAVTARWAIRDVERFAYRIVSDAEEIGELSKARNILRMAVGLRRKLDQWNGVE